MPILWMYMVYQTQSNAFTRSLDTQRKVADTAYSTPIMVTLYLYDIILFAIQSLHIQY